MKFLVSLSSKSWKHRLKVVIGFLKREKASCKFLKKAPKAALQANMPLVVIEPNK